MWKELLDYIFGKTKSIKNSLSKDWMNKPYSQWTDEDKEKFNEEISSLHVKIDKTYSKLTGEVEYCVYYLCFYLGTSERRVERYYKHYTDAKRDYDGRIEMLICDYLHDNFSTNIL